MDLLAHALYGATVCSRTGLAGGKAGSGRRFWIADWTVWFAALFGILPDIISMGLPFIAYLRAGAPGHIGCFFRDFDGSGIILYRYVHSLIVAFAACGILRLARRPLFLPSLAWPLHILLDALTHNAGKWGTTIFYPLSDWAFPGIPFWQYRAVPLTYWTLLPIIWLALWAVRTRRRHT